MAKLVLEIDDALLSRALIDSQEQEISLDTFVSEALNSALASPTPAPVQRVVNVNDVIASAVDRARAQALGSEFMLIELCDNEDWEALSGGERKSLGKGFRKEVEGMNPPIAEFVRRTSSNKAVYKRV